MFTMRPYSYWKVLIGFTFAPAIGGIVFVYLEFLILPFVKEIFIKEKLNWISTSHLSISFEQILSLAALAMVIYAIPAFLLAVIYVLLKLHRSLKSYIFITAMGGFGAFIWSRVFLEWFDIACFLGAISSLIMARFVLPKKEPVDWDEFEDPDIP